MAPVNNQPIGVFCVDDNEHVAEALRIKLGRSGHFRWMGWLASADRLVESVECSHPDVVLLDVDMPGRNPFEALAELLERCPDTKAIIFSGHSSKELVDQAVEAGAWGFVSKSDGEEALVDIIQRVKAGEFVLSPEVRATCDR